MTQPERYYSGPIDIQGAIVSVYGWYGEQAWVKVRLVRKTRQGWLVLRLLEPQARYCWYERSTPSAPITSLFIFAFSRMIKTYYGSRDPYRVELGGAF